MKFLITGSAGFIGKNLASYYKDHEVIEFKRSMDIDDTLNYFKPDVILNCAAEIYDVKQMWSSNVELTKSCLDFCVKEPSTKMIQLGSSSEYGPNYDRATAESDALNPVDMYSGTKGISTLLCQTYGNVHKTDVVIIRPYSPYGPGEKPHRLFPNFWRSFKLGAEMNLVMGVHDFCYIDDLVEAIDAVIRNDNRTPGEILNVSSGIETTNLEVLETFRKVTGLEGNVIIQDRFVTQRVWKCDNEKIKLKYGWTPKINLEDGVKLFLERGDYQ